MAYVYKEKGERTNVATIEKNNRGEYFKVDKIVEEGKGNQIDVRAYYTDSDTGEVRPTSKGIRIKSELTADILIAMYNAMDEESKQEFNDMIDAERELDAPEEIVQDEE